MNIPKTVSHMDDIITNLNHKDNYVFFVRHAIDYKKRIGNEYLYADIDSFSSWIKKQFLKLHPGTKLLSSEEMRILFYKAIIQTEKQLFSHYDVQLTPLIMNWYLNSALLQIKETKASEKVNEINRIIQTYQALKKEIGLDYIDVLQIMLENDVDYSNTTFIFENIYEYQGLEKDLVQKLLCNPAIIVIRQSEQTKTEEQWNQYLRQLGISFPTQPNHSITIPLFSAEDLLEEVVATANQIKELMITNGYSYHDIAITSGNIAPYQKYLHHVFDQVKIPFTKPNSQNKSFWNFLLYVMELNDESLTNEKLQSILKLHILPISERSILRFSKERKKATELSINCFTEEEQELLYRFLKDVSSLFKIDRMKPWLESFYQLLITWVGEDNSEVDTRDFNDVIDLINLYDTFDENTSTLLPLFLFDLKERKTTVKKKLHEVFVGEIRDVAYRNYKKVFLLGACEGVLLKNTASDLFSTHEQKEYMTTAHLGLDYDSQVIDLDNIIRNTPVTIFHHQIGDDNRKYHVSSYLEQLRDVTFEKSKASIWKDNIHFEEFLYDYGFRKNEDIEQNVTYYNCLLEMKPISSDKMKQYLDGGIRLSASKIETFFQNPFWYFCKYILKLNPEQNQAYDARLVGTFVHFILEKAIKEKAEMLTTEAYLNPFLIEHEITRLTEIYLLTNLFEKTKNLYRIYQEMLSHQNFIPSLFEYSMTESGTAFAFSYRGFHVEIKGIVDRIDLLDHHALVLDYKTGPKPFRYELTEIGMNLQLLLYLLFIRDYTPYEPLGAFYLPAYYKQGSEESDYCYHGIMSEELLKKIDSDHFESIMNTSIKKGYEKKLIIKEAEFHKLIDYTHIKINEMLEKILQGTFEISPHQEVKEYDDPYQTMAGLDVRFRNYRKTEKDTDEIFERMMG